MAPMICIPLIASASRRAPDSLPTVIFEASREPMTPDSAVMAPVASFSVVMAPGSIRVEPTALYSFMPAIDWMAPRSVPFAWLK